MNQKVKLGLIVLVAAGIIFLGYRLRNRAEIVAPINNSGNAGSETNNQNNNPAGEIGSLKPVLEDKLLAYLVGDQDVLGVKTDGRVIKKSSSKIEVLSDADFEDVRGASFSYDGKRILLEVGGYFKFFNTEKSSWRDLPLMSSPAWSPNNHDLAYISGGDTTYISLLNVDLSTFRPRNITRLDFEDTLLAWIDSGHLALSEKGASLLKTSSWAINTQTKAWNVLVYEKQGVSSIWDGKGNGLVFTSSGRGGTLTLVNNKGESLRNLEVLTLPDKCAFSDASLICAIPKDTKALSGSFLPDAYNKGGITTEDYFIEISLGSGEIISRFDPAQSLDATNLTLKGKGVYFINKSDGKLYSMGLKK